MDNMVMDSFFFFIPNRLVWDNWEKFMGQQENPDDSIDYVIPQQTSPEGGYAIGSLQDYMGLPTVGQMDPTKTIDHCAFFTRAYSLVWNQWFRDENLQDSVLVYKGDVTDTTAAANYELLRRGKRKDYFTSSLPWPQKGDAVKLPLGSSAPVTYGGSLVTSPVSVKTAGNTGNYKLLSNSSGSAVYVDSTSTLADTQTLYADLSEATAATINQLRQSFQIQKLLERDARGGTRYTEIIRSHFGVISPDARLQRPEYLGGGSTPININPIAQTSASAATGTNTPLGTLASMGTALAHNHGFTQSFVEHGVVIGLVSIRADLTYQQGLARMWSRETRYDFYFPAFAMLGEQAVLNKEIYVTGNSTDDDVFGYQERWAEYRYYPSRISGLFRSTASGTIDAWHLAQKFTTVPTLNDTFIADTPPVERVVAVGAAANGKQFIFDSFFDVKKARPLPMYSVPGLIDHF